MILQISRELSRVFHALDKHSKLNEFLSVQEVCGRLRITYRWFFQEVFKVDAKHLTIIIDQSLSLLSKVRRKH